MQMTRRVKIHTGLRCNAKCRFCYYWDQLDSQNLSIEEIKAKLHYAKRHGIKDVDFSGGEPTIRHDFPELVSYAKDLDFRYICVITNGIKLANKEYFERLVKNGLNDILFSIEGHCSEVHDYLIQIPGSFKKINKAIQNAREFEIRLRNNTTVTSVNYRYLPELAGYLVGFQPDAVNLILFNDWCSANKLIRSMACRYSDAAPYLKKAIDVLDPQVRKVTVRYIPFCFTVNYEKYVCDLLQKKYDPDEWVDSVKTRLLSKINNGRATIGYWAFILREYVRHPAVIRRSKFKPYELFHDTVIEQMRDGYSKGPECKNCKYFYICDGLENSYASAIGLSELKPVIGQQIKDPLYYRREYMYQWDEC